MIKNITTNIACEKTIAEIEKLLATFGAGAVLKEYDGTRVSALSFYITAPTGERIPFRLPMKVEKTRRMIEEAVRSKKLPRRFLNEPLRTEKAMNVGWRIIKTGG